MLIIKTIYQDEDLLVIDKPWGVVVDRAKTTANKTIQDWVEKKKLFKKEKNNHQTSAYNEYLSRSGIVHRLDKETSGLMVISRNLQAFNKLKEQFKKRLTKKNYLALTHSRLRVNKGDINLPLARNPDNRKKFTVRLKGRQALTEYELLNNYFLAKEEFTFLAVKPRTGRTHQIRAHLSYLGYPLVSDPLYLNKKKLKQDKLWCPRLFLHSSELEFFHPRTEKRMKFKIKLADDLSKSLNKLRLI